MPAFIKTEKDEANWQKAKKLVHKHYPDLTEDDDKFWKLTTSLYKRVGGSLHKQAGEYVVKPKDTFNALDLRHGFPIGSFSKANPGVNPRKLKIGQRLNVPSPSVRPRVPEPELPITANDAEAQPTNDDLSSLSNHPMYNRYRAITEAETGSFKDKWIRTKGVPGSSSTAWGPAQITGSTMRDYMTRYKNKLSKYSDFHTNVLDPMYRNLAKYGREPNKPGYDKRYEYGGYGVRLTPEQKLQYANLAMDMMLIDRDEILKKRPNLRGQELQDALTERWRGKPYKKDKRYFDVVNRVLNNNK